MQKEHTKILYSLWIYWTPIIAGWAKIEIMAIVLSIFLLKFSYIMFKKVHNDGYLLMPNLCMIYLC